MTALSHQTAKEEIRRSADIVELIGQFVQLRKAGLSYVGLCPFHSEKDPSFTVSPERQTFHCFGCKKGGDIFSFWMEYHSSTFPEALRDLAERYHVAVSEGFSSEAGIRESALRETLFRINEMATCYFQESLTDPVRGKAGREYLNCRSLPQEIIVEFRLGYAPDLWDGLVAYLKSHEVDLDIVGEGGLVIPRKSGGHYDRFRGRIIFPIFDSRQQVVGFGGRVMDDSLPKYLNTPENPVFRKGEFLYGLHASFKTIREKGRAVIVEGYMDCLALRKHGLKEVVATLGTALTAAHVRKLKGYAKEVVVLFDADEAGKKAALRSLPVFSNEGLLAKAVTLPDGHDPDTFVNAYGLDRLLEFLDRASSTFDFYLEQTLVETDSGIEEKARVLKELLPMLSETRDFTQRSLYVQRLSERIGIRENLVLSELEGFMKSYQGKAPGRGMKERLTVTGAEKRLGDLQLLNLVVHYSHTVPRLMESGCEILLSDPAVVEIVNTVFEVQRREGLWSAEILEERLCSDTAREQLREIIHRPFILLLDQDVEQAVSEIEEKAYRKRISASFEKVRGDKEAQNRLLKLMVQGPDSI